MAAHRRREPSRLRCMASGRYAMRSHITYCAENTLFRMTKDVRAAAQPSMKSISFSWPGQRRSLTKYRVSEKAIPTAMIAVEAAASMSGASPSRFQDPKEEDTSVPQSPSTSPISRSDPATLSTCSPRSP